MFLLATDNYPHVSSSLFAVGTSAFLVHMDKCTNNWKVHLFYFILFLPLLLVLAIKHPISHWDLSGDHIM